MDNITEIDDLSTICRVCLEKPSKMYPLVGPILNVDVDVATMISCCTAEEIELDEDLPKGVCIPCFRTVRIAYNFILEFREANKKLLDFRELIKNKQENKHKEDIVNDFLSNEEITASEYSHQEEENEEELVYENVIKCEEEETNVSCFEDIFDHVSNAADLDEKLQTESDDKVEEIVDVKKELDVSSERRAPCQSLRRKATVRVYQCPTCFKKITKFNAVFIPHLYSHKDELFNCNLCESTPEMDLEDYMLHFKQFHLYQCGICNKSFNKKSTHNYHMKNHMETKVYNCSYENCKKKFVNPWSLKKHVNTHSKSVMYICSKCGRKFNTYDTFRYHQKTHDGNRSHLCPHCGRSFLQSVHLKYHMWKHTGIKQFRCKKCDKSYTSVTQLKKHLRKYCGFEEAESANEQLTI